MVKNSNTIQIDAVFKSIFLSKISFVVGNRFGSVIQLYLALLEYSFDINQTAQRQILRGRKLILVFDVNFF